MKMKIAATLFICLVFFALILLASCQLKKEESLFPVEVNGKLGYINKTGKIVIKPQFDYNEPEWFSEGLAVVKIGSDEKETGKIDQYGRKIPVDYKYGYIDKTGKIIIKPQFNDAGGFFEGLASVIIGDKRGYIDKTGKIVINPQFDDAGEFSKGGLAQVRIGGEWRDNVLWGGKSGYIDKTGKTVWISTE